MMWPDDRIQQLLRIDLPILQAPMAGSTGARLAIAVSEAGGLGSLPCAMLGPAQIRSEMELIRQQTARPINLNFFCHMPPSPDSAREDGWRRRLAAYYAELGVDETAATQAPSRTPFDEAACDLVEEFRPEVVSFHFGLPAAPLLERVRKTGAKILSSATSVDEARWLEDHGCDAIIAQGVEAGGHRGMFASEDIATQVGTFALTPQIVDAVKAPVIAAGAIADARGIVAAFALGAAAVQIGTAYLMCPEAATSRLHRAALRDAKDNATALTNIFSGRPARGVVNRVMRELGPMSEAAPAFPLATGALAPLRARAESMGSGDFSPLWAGQAAAMARECPAGELTRRLAQEAQALLARMAAGRNAQA